jgi:RHS repeat-associated protein
MSVTNPCSVFCCIENGNNAGGYVECAVGTTETMYYVHKDYLGSISAITDASGNLVESLSYDPCSVKLGFCEHSETKALVEPIPTEVQGREGRRRNPSDWSDYNVCSTLFDRGFTGHEHLDHFGLINMNGRVYDPFLARFLSPDPFIQAPSYTQNYNRYSYAWNNPLKYTDPSGYSVILDENTTNIPYIAGGSGFAGNWNNMTGGFGPGSGRHWSDQHRSEWGNFMLGSGRSFDRMYGQGASAYYIGYYTGENTRYVWNPVAGNEVYRESGKGYVNIYFSGDWVKASPFTGPTFGGSVPMYSNALTDGPGGISGRVDGNNSLLNTVNSVNTWFGAGLFGADWILTFSSDISYKLAYSPIAKASSFIRPAGFGTSFVGIAIGVTRFAISDYSWGSYGQLGVSILSSALTLSHKTAPFGIAISAVDLFGGFNGFYSYLDEQQNFYDSYGWLILPLYPYPVIIINPRP